MKAKHQQEKQHRKVKSTLPFSKRMSLLSSFYLLFRISLVVGCEESAVRRASLRFPSRLSEFSSSRTSGFETECSEARSSTIGSTRVRPGLLVSSSIS